MEELSSIHKAVEDSFISRVAVKGLHKRLDFDVKLTSGINVIYGMNGIGKTTLLHIIANLSEIDIARFQSLSFEGITIESSRGQTIQLLKDADEISVIINHQKTSYEHGKVELSELEEGEIRSIIGERATYLPAFRSVLERMRENTYGIYEDRSRPELENLTRKEMKILDSSRRDDLVSKRGGEFAQKNAIKTLRCRQWFGEFVPVIRYPSIMDVDEGLSSEWERAQVNISRMEQKQIESAFVSIFSAIAKGDESAENLSQKDLLETINSLILNEDDNILGPVSNSTYQKLVQASESTSDRDRKYNNLLQIYVDILKERKANRENVMAPINEFQSSVNMFLSRKSLNIGYPNSARILPRRRSNVYIKPGAGKSYRLTSLSSGERQIVTMLYSASRSPFKSGCFLIDEPELSLHIDWQRMILEHIEKQHQGRQIIACTHSPEVGADHENRVQFFSPSLAEENSDDNPADVEEI